MSEHGTPILVGRAVRKAFTHTADILFRPFKFTNWLKLGLCALLASLVWLLGEGNIQLGNLNTLPQRFQRILDDLRDDFLFTFSIGALWVIGIIVAQVLFSWLGARGHFMLLDNVRHNRSLIKQPWTRFATQANSLFRVLFIATTANILLLALAAIVSIAIAWPDLVADQFTRRSGIAIATFALVVIPSQLAFVLLLAVCIDFVAPVMARRRQTFFAAWSTMRHELIAGHVGDFVRFYLMRIVVTVAGVIIGFLVLIPTFCLASLPYISHVVLLPVIVYTRCFSLCFIEQFGPNWRMFVDQDIWLPECVTCGYDLTGLGDQGTCPECGAAFAKPEAPPPPEAPPTAPADVSGS